MRRPFKNSFLRYLISTARLFLDLISYIDFIISRKSSTLINQFDEIESNKVAIYVGLGKPTENDLEVVDSLRKLGWQVFHIRNFNVRDASLQKELEEYSDLTLRNNLGYDFGAFRDVVLSVVSPSEVLLINSSMIWNVRKLEEILHKIQIRAKLNESTFLTESIQRKSHGQTFFAYFKLDEYGYAVLQEFFYRFIKNTRMKRSAVNFGELKMSNFLVENGISIYYEFPYEEVRQEYLSLVDEQREDWISDLAIARVPLNPSQHFWRALCDLGLPGIKKTLIYDNPAGLEKIPSKHDLDFYLK
jgi:effector-binding domain-containing protein